MLNKTKMVFFTIFVLLTSIAIAVPEKDGDALVGPNGSISQRYKDIGPSASWYYTTVFGPDGKAKYTWGTLVIKTPFGDIGFPFEYFHDNNKRAIKSQEKSIDVKDIKFANSRIEYKGEDIGPLRMFVTDLNGRLLGNQVLKPANGYKSLPISEKNKLLIITIRNEFFIGTKKVIIK